MLLEFKVKNFRSIKDWQSFSMLAENKVKEHDDVVTEKTGFNFLASSIVYGRNASGKSNLLKALNAFDLLVTNSASFKEGQEIKFYDPFKLSAKANDEPVEFYIDFLAENEIRYIYSVGYGKSAIEYEKLVFYPKSKPATLYSRIKNQKISYGEYLTGRKKEIEDFLYPNQLFLSKVGTEKNEQLKIPHNFFAEKLVTVSAHDTELDKRITRIIMNVDNPVAKVNINKLMKVADTGIERIYVRQQDFDDSSLPDNMPLEEREYLSDKYKYQIKTVRNTFDNNEESGEIEFSLEDESTGTKKLLIVGGIAMLSMIVGAVLIIDELDKSLHPKLTRALIKLFHSKKTNPNNAQLIFATHDVSLLDPDLFRRDQVWFAEKEQEGDSHYYALSDIPGVRANTPYEKWYMSGRFGATPSINEYELDFEF
ncbi:MAG: ATP-binding protein [Cytophagales bacterium]|nr:ATP-binding protein [Cytophagales bacterium]